MLKCFWGICLLRLERQQTPFIRVLIWFLKALGNKCSVQLLKMRSKMSNGKKSVHFINVVSVSCRAWIRELAIRDKGEDACMSGRVLGGNKRARKQVWWWMGLEEAMTSLRSSKQQTQASWERTWLASTSQLSQLGFFFSFCVLSQDPRKIITKLQTWIKTMEQK